MNMQLGNFGSITVIKNNHESRGGHFFQNSSFHNSRIGSNVYGRCVFVTSECMNPSHWTPNPQREYTVRLALADGGIETLGEYGGYSTRAQAHAAAKRMAAALRDGTLAYNPQTYKWEYVELPLNND